jgi:hypothetical protein
MHNLEKKVLPEKIDDRTIENRTEKIFAGKHACVNENQTFSTDFLVNLLIENFVVVQSW